MTKRQVAEIKAHPSCREMYALAAELEKFAELLRDASGGPSNRFTGHLRGCSSFDPAPPIAHANRPHCDCGLEKRRAKLAEWGTKEDGTTEIKNTNKLPCMACGVAPGEPHKSSCVVGIERGELIELVNQIVTKNDLAALREWAEAELERNRPTRYEATLRFILGMLDVLDRTNCQCGLKECCGLTGCRERRMILEVVSALAAGVLK